MQLVVKTKILARTENNKLVDWASREYRVPLKKQIYDIDLFEKMVFKVKAKIEKHSADVHEHVASWYVIPDDALPDSEAKQVQQYGSVVFQAREVN